MTENDTSVFTERTSDYSAASSMGQPFNLEKSVELVPEGVKIT
jgi:hypothetical protein